MKTVVVLGAGKMTGALLKGLAAHTPLHNFYIYSPSGISAAALAKEVSAKHLADLDSAPEADYVILGCKPQQLKELQLTIGERFKNAILISMLAAVPEAQQRKILDRDKLVRIMPNLPVQFGKGITLICSGSAKGVLEEVKQILTPTGEVLTVEEAELEELTILTGSGPALFYEFAQNLANAFTSLDSGARESLVRHVLSGAAANVSRDESDLQNLIDEVTSKGGVTIAVLENWRKQGLQTTLKEGVSAGLVRAREIKERLQN